jgi:hypothetical protein
MPTSVRLDAKTESLLRRLARQKRLTKSAVIREAVLNFAREEAARPRKTPFEAAAHLIGSIKGLPPDLSERTGDRFYKMLVEQHRK